MYPYNDLIVLSITKYKNTLMAFRREMGTLGLYHILLLTL